MEQTRLESLAEATINTFVGLVFGLAGQLVIFPLYGIHVTLSVNIQTLFWFTLISLARSYVVRRWCAAHLRRVSRSVAQKLSRVIP